MSYILQIERKIKPHKLHFSITLANYSSRTTVFEREKKKCLTLDIQTREHVSCFRKMCVLY